MRVLVATDLTDGADLALREGASMAASPADSMAAVYALPLPPLLEAMFPSTASLEKPIALAAQAVGQQVRRVCGRDATVFVESGVNYAAIVSRAEAWEADVLVVGSHGRAGASRVLGGVAEAAVRQAHCSVLVARPSTGHGCVLAGTDDSDPSFPAITAGAREALRRGVKLEVVQALGIVDTEAIYLLQPSATQNVFVVAARSLSERVAKLGVDASCKVLDRPAAAAIVSEAESIGADLIVVGSRGRTGLARLALGSVAEKVIRAASCSVLVVRRGAIG
jgi:nucleotide-binding universal stress UspA family protein